MFYDGGYMGGMHGWWWLFWVLLVVAVLFYSWQRPRSHHARQGAAAQAAPHSVQQDKPLEVLRRRLASGEITPQQYEERKTLLDRDG